MEGHALPLDRAADALGLSRRTVAYYLSGEQPVPKTVMLATEGYDKREAARKGQVGRVAPAPPPAPPPARRRARRGRLWVFPSRHPRAPPPPCHWAMRRAARWSGASMSSEPI